jgi:uncharacterized protein (DUF58 family)
MIVLFTEFTDLTSADFMVRAARRMVETHLLLVVVLRDEELETIADAMPERPADVTRAVTAAALIRDRRLVLTRLQHLGVHVIESEYDRVGERLVAGCARERRRSSRRGRSWSMPAASEPPTRPIGSGSTGW